MAIERKSIDYIAEDERHGRVIDQVPFWFLGNFHFFTIAIGFVGPEHGLELRVHLACRGAGILFGTLFVAFHASQGAELGMPQMIQSRAQFGFRGVVVVLFGTLFTFIGFNVADSVLMARGLNGILGWNETLVTLIAAAAAIGDRDLRARLAPPDLPRVLLAVPAALHPVDGGHHGGPGAGDPSCAGRLQLGRVHRAIRRERGLQHHLRALGVRLFPIPAAHHTAASHYRRGLPGRHLGRDLVDLAGRLARHAHRGLRRARGAARCR